MSYRIHPDASWFFNLMISTFNLYPAYRVIIIIFQVIRYRPGGQFPPNLDFFTQEQINKQANPGLGNRVGHVMVFLQHVELGGGFAMPELGIYVSPKPGRMVHWRNVDKNGEKDHKSLHGGCYIYSGNKQVAVKDYHQNLQKHWICEK